MKFFVTGVAGQLGHDVMNELAKRGYEGVGSDIAPQYSGVEDGSNYYGGMAEGLVGITNLASFAAEGTQEKVDEATAAILSGQSNVFDGVMTTNTGETIGQEGSTLDDATITGRINRRLIPPKEAAIPTRMILAFRECRKISGCPPIRLCARS